MSIAFTLTGSIVCETGWRCAKVKAKSKCGPLIGLVAVMVEATLGGNSKIRNLVPTSAVMGLKGYISNVCLTCVMAGCGLPPVGVNVAVMLITLSGTCSTIGSSSTPVRPYSDSRYNVDVMMSPSTM